ncbi:UDP-N-acetylglucosamine 2-epimerase [Photorhabdus antumapuensis]|uniref:UDP-N-acetylglucosamine 2-epimerase n=1 Tax=Photorhabdus antumapuensis TaxID=2862867 RepID=UPI001CEC2A8E|nr:UDP-N-acetylglucosamine 2-epimerase [Photorhabdus antumapuensis]MCA6222231.1 UDP-N-acetylglucosamine 2-epimerase (hydrolyzing) [Photorhabdus antumapuensis]
MMRKICYITGTRADFGLIQSTLTKINQHPELQLSLAVTGMHLDPKFGLTQKEIFACKLDTYVVDSCLNDDSRLSISCSISEQLKGLSILFTKLIPDLILVLGDRGEMLAAAIAALYMNIPVAHIHGGERSGTIDESIRHAISKLSHFHFVATNESKTRLIRMGEKEENIFITGAPGLDDILNIQLPTKGKIFNSLLLNPQEKLLTLIYHPVVQDAESAGEDIKKILNSIPQGLQTIILLPNADTGGNLIRSEIFKYATKRNNIKIVTHLHRELYLSLIAYSDVLMGNSSSGIIEAASFGTRVINIGERQNNRERNRNVIDVPIDTLLISNYLEESLSAEKIITSNIYGDGNAGERITNLLATLRLDNDITKKCNTY